MEACGQPRQKKKKKKKSEPLSQKYSIPKEVWWSGLSGKAPA
jgi:hypothetical protein